MSRCAASILFALLCAACGRPSQEPAAAARAQNLLVITVDTLRADRVGAYGDRSARTPALDGLAARGALFTHAYATAPITLPSHASLFTGRYPAGHGSRHNGMRLDLAVPTVADRVSQAGFATAAFIAAFPLDRRFGLIKGFQTYSDRMPRGAGGRPANERAGREVVDEAIQWLQRTGNRRFFAWVHLFEPHAPYGDPRRAGGTAQSRYAEEVAEADRQIARLLAAIQPHAASTLVVATADHGEAFGEHGEISHSVFVYDTTLRVPLIIAGPGVPAARIEEPVTQVDVAATALGLLGVAPMDTDGVDLGRSFLGHAVGERTLYAESYAPLFDFGWSPLRAVRHGGWKYIDAPKPELYHVAADPDENSNRVPSENTRAQGLREQIARYAGPEVTATATKDPEAAARLQALGYIGGGGATRGAARPDPKEKRELAARIARVASGELRGRQLEQALRAIVAEDPANPQANLRLGYVLMESNRCAEAIALFRAAIEASLPSADPHLGLAACQAARRDFAGAAKTLREAERVEPGNPVVTANLGIVLSDGGDPAAGIEPLQRALTTDPTFHQARFGLALAFARAGRREEANRTARELLSRLGPDAPQRNEVERLIRETQ